MGRWCRRYAAHFAAVGAAFYTTVRVSAARFFKMLVLALCHPFHSCWCRLLHYGEGKRSPFFGRGCRRYAAHFSAVGAAVCTTVRVDAARFCSAVGVGVVVPNFTAVGAAFYTTAIAIAAGCFSAVGVGVRLPILLLLGTRFTLRLG